MTLKINHDTIEHNGEPVADIRPLSSPVFNDLRDKINDCQEFAEKMEDGEYVTLQEFNEIKEEKEEWQSICQRTKDALEGLMCEFDGILEGLSKPAQKALEQWAVDMTAAIEDITT